MSKRYILDEAGEPILCADIHAWARAFEKPNRIVAQSTVKEYQVSTVFLGMDHGWSEGPPVLWETMVFGDGPMDNEQHRCSGSREQALAMHESVCAKLLAL